MAVCSIAGCSILIICICTQFYVQSNSVEKIHPFKSYKFQTGFVYAFNVWPQFYLMLIDDVAQIGSTLNIMWTKCGLSL